MTPSSCRRLQNQFTINTWTENPPSSTPLLDITKIDLDNVHVRSFFRLPVSRNLDAKGLCCVLRCQHGIRRRPLRQVLGSSFKAFFEKLMSSAFCLSKNSRELLAMALPSLCELKTSKNILHGPRRPDTKINFEAFAWFSASGSLKILQRFCYGSCFRNSEIMKPRIHGLS